MQRVRPTLNLGTGRSVSLYLVHRRPIRGSLTMSTGGIPGFWRETQKCDQIRSLHATHFNSLNFFTCPSDDDEEMKIKRAVHLTVKKKHREIN